MFERYFYLGDSNQNCFVLKLWKMKWTYFVCYSHSAAFYPDLLVAVVFVLTRRQQSHHPNEKKIFMHKYVKNMCMEYIFI